MEETISLSEIFQLLKKRFLLITMTFLLGTGIASATTFFLIAPSFSSSAEIIVQSKESGTQNLQTDINANVLLINTYKDMIMGDIVMLPVMEALAAEHGYQHTKSELRGIVSVIQSQNSQMFQIRATTHNPEQAAIIANLTASVFQVKAHEVLDVNRVTITTNASANPSPVAPNNMLNVMIGAIAGLMVGVGVSFLLEFLDKTVKDERYIKEEVGFPIMGVISEMSSKEQLSGISLEETIIPKPAKAKPTRNKEIATRINTRRNRERV
ncbi:MAG: tyrosine protein kinase [Streptococcaceae bacterium]|jgi:capsular polysaccharide biosynthesis protein|nr:tyrosine protein kinase [Streptococcaceae bacterium]